MSCFHFYHDFTQSLLRLFLHIQLSFFGKLFQDRKSTRLNSSHANISYAVFCLKKKKKSNNMTFSHQTFIPLTSTHTPHFASTYISLHPASISSSSIYLSSTLSF